MDRLQININGTDYNLDTMIQSAVSWDLTTWYNGVQNDEKYWYALTSFEDIPTPPGALGITYGSYILMLSNGMYLTVDYQETYGIYNDYITVSGLFNQDGTTVDTGVTSSGSDITNLKIFGVQFLNGTEVLYGIALQYITNGDPYGYVFLFNSAIYDENIIPPYEDGPEDPIQGGWGTWDRSTDGVGANATPSALAPFNAGIHMYTLNAAALKSFTGFLWGSDESIFAALWSRYTNYVYNPIGAIIACHVLPTEFTPSGTTTTAIQLAGTALPISGTLKAANTQFIDKSYNLDLAEFYGDFMDYTSTRLILHLPFCGVCVLDPVYVVGGGLTVLYRCDVCTGNVSAFVICRNRAGRSELIQVTGGNAAYTTALTGHSDGMLEALGNASKTIAGGVATAMTGVPVSTGSTDSPLMQKESTTVTGAFSGSAAITSSLDLYLEIVYTEPSNPAGYTTLRGRPADIGGTVGSFTGYTIFSDIHADGIYRATDEEKRMIEQQLKGGVIV